MIVSSTFFLVSLSSLFVLVSLLTFAAARQGRLTSRKALLTGLLAVILLGEIFREAAAIAHGAYFPITPLRIIIFRAEHCVLGAYIWEVWSNVQDVLSKLSARRV